MLGGKHFSAFLCHKKTKAQLTGCNIFGVITFFRTFALIIFTILKVKAELQPNYQYNES